MMYNLLKKILFKLVNKKQLLKYEVAFRNLYSVFYSGSKHQCSVCGKKLSAFIKLKNHDLMCPKCGSLARDRRLWSLLNSEFLKGDLRVLDFSPSKSLSRAMNKKSDIEYLNTDLSGDFIAKYRFDITNLELDSESVDLIVCYHILEHIIDDKKAMSELYRVLKPGGYCLVQTPYKEGDIYEDYSITNPKEREVHFGQDDHVRYYSVTGLKERLEQTGFVTDIRNYKKDDYLGLADNETIFIITK